MLFSCCRLCQCILYDTVSLSPSAVECSSLSSPLNGVVELTETMSGEFTVAVATYRCNEGFLLSSRDRVRICTASRGGKWTGIEPMCEGTLMGFSTLSYDIPFCGQDVSVYVYNVRR